MSNTNLPNQSALIGIARALVQHGWLSQAHGLKVAQTAADKKIEMIEAVIEQNIPNINAQSLARFCAEAFGHPLLDVSSLMLEALPKDILDDKKIAEYKAIPLKKRGNLLYVAMSDPTALNAINQIQFATQTTVEPIIVEHDKLKAMLEKLANQTSSLNDFAMEDIDLDQVQTLDAAPEQENEGGDSEDAPIVKFIQGIIVQAVNMGASDLHFEPYEKTYRIRFRIDGILKEIATPPVSVRERIASRLKIISRLDIAEKRIPQDGRMKLAITPQKVIDFRVSTLPTLFGEKIVMRILDPSSAKLGIDALGYDPEQKEKLLFAIGRSYGMILVTGPTGSGKTVSLYTCLNILNQPGTNIATAEDPAEINLPGINQVNVNEKAGLSFSAALKSFLRQDPDIIMVGEIRDLETADIAIKAAQTGHLVLSTLHTNDAPTTLTRLLNMGVAPFNIASSVILITAQRLGRRLCTCKKPLEASRDYLLSIGFRESDLDGTWQPYAPVGCERCGGSGYKGRVGIYQVMPITEAMQSIILKNGDALQIAKQAEAEGVDNLRRAGLLKVKQGIASIEEILAITNE